MINRFNLSNTRSVSGGNPMSRSQGMMKSRLTQAQLRDALKNRGMGSTQNATPSELPLQRYKPGFNTPDPMEALDQLSSAVTARRRRGRLSISGLGDMG